MREGPVRRGRERGIKGEESEGKVKDGQVL